MLVYKLEKSFAKDVDTGIRYSKWIEVLLFPALPVPQVS